MQSQQTPANDIEKQWFALRDLKRANAKLPGYKQLGQEGFDVFTPMQTRIATICGRRVRQTVPYIPDLLFVYSDRKQLDPIISKTETLQYRYVKGAPHRTPLTVRKEEMNIFITAVTTLGDVTYLTPDEVTPNAYYRQIRIHCNGPLDGIEATLLTVKGSAKKRLLVQLPGILAAAVEINPDYIEIL